MTKPTGITFTAIPTMVVTVRDDAALLATLKKGPAIFKVEDFISLKALNTSVLKMGVGKISFKTMHIPDGDQWQQVLQVTFLDGVAPGKYMSKRKKEAIEQSLTH